MIFRLGKTQDLRALAAPLISGRDSRERALLKARLLDLMIGDWDRHRDQWRWAKLPGHPIWQPISDDRDQAFCRYQGVLLALARNRQPIFQNYGPRYKGIANGLTFNGREQDRFLLTDLELEPERKRHRERVVPGAEVRRRRRRGHDAAAVHARNTASSTDLSSGSHGTTGAALFIAVWGSLRPLPVKTQTTRPSAP